MASALRNRLRLTTNYELGLEIKESYNLSLSKAMFCTNDFKPKQVIRREQSISTGRKLTCYSNASINNSIHNARQEKWWEGNNTVNMREIQSTKDLVYTLRNAGDKLVIVYFYSPVCGGCRALHSKIRQLAELNTNVLFLKVNHEEHKSMCYSLHVHVLPFFWFYRGTEGRVCRFSCTISTIYKFKNALEKYRTERQSLGPAKGLDESELLSLASNKDIDFEYPVRFFNSEDYGVNCVIN